MNIAFIHPSFPSAGGTGATHSATQIVTHLARSRHDIDVYCAAKPHLNEITSNLDLYYLSGESRHPQINIRLNREVQARLNKSAEYDIVHSYMTSTIPALNQLSQTSDMATVVTLNAYAGVCLKNDLLYMGNERYVIHKLLR